MSENVGVKRLLAVNIDRLVWFTDQRDIKWNASTFQQIITCTRITRITSRVIQLQAHKRVFVFVLF